MKNKKMSRSEGEGKLLLLLDNKVRDVHKYLYEGSVFGGASLEALIEQYKSSGPTHVVRWELISHIQRCLVALVDLDATIVATANAVRSFRAPKFPGAK